LLLALSSRLLALSSPARGEVHSLARILAADEVQHKLNMCTDHGKLFHSIIVVLRIADS
jgi:hypothetical protein